jgi:PadR family transcriptional regulator PadR
VGKGFLTYATTVILQAVATVYPALRRLEDAGHLDSKWENEHIAQGEPRPRRKYYDLTRDGREALADAVKRYRLAAPAPPIKARPKPSRA